MTRAVSQTWRRIRRGVGRFAPDDLAGRPAELMTQLACAANGAEAMKCWNDTPIPVTGGGNGATCSSRSDRELVCLMRHAVEAQQYRAHIWRRVSRATSRPRAGPAGQPGPDNPELARSNPQCRGCSPPERTLWRTPVPAARG